MRLLKCEEDLHSCFLALCNSGMLILRRNSPETKQRRVRDRSRKTPAIFMVPLHSLRSRPLCSAQLRFSVKTLPKKPRTNTQIYIYRERQHEWSWDLHLLYKNLLLKPCAVLSTLGIYDDCHHLKEMPHGPHQS